MKNIDSNIDYSAVRKRIDKEKQGYKPSEWAKKVGVKNNVISNIHGKLQQRPSLQYIVAVSKATDKSVDYYLWGIEPDGIQSRDPEINELLRNTKYVLEADHPEITPALKSNIVAFHGAVQRERHGIQISKTPDADRGKEGGRIVKNAGR